MIKHYLKVAFRSLVKQKIYSIINILGLAISMAACLLILLYVKHEVSYDSFFTKADRIYKLGLERKYPNHSTFYAVIPHSFADVMKKDFPEVANTLIVSGPNRSLVSYRVSDNEIKAFEEEYLLAADSSFFSFFDLELVKGDRQSALSGPNQIVINETTAEKYFGDIDPLGKTIKVDNNDFKVTGISKNLPENTHLRFDFMASLSTIPFFKRENFTGFDSHVYIELREGSNPANLESKFPKMVDTYAAAQIERTLGKSWEDYKNAGNGYRYILQPLTAIHLDPTNYEATITPGGNRRYVYILFSIAVLVMVIACINFINLATARSSERAREVGVRKTMGSFRSHLVIQFLVESLMVSIMATIISIIIIQVFIPVFNSLSGKQLSLAFSSGLFTRLFGLTIIVALMAGLYPAFVLSGFNPVIVMKGNFSGSSKGSWMRNGLVVFQFMISIILIVGTLIVGEQMYFLQNKNMGFNKERVVMVDRAFSLGPKQKTFIEEVKRLGNVISAGRSSAMVGKRDNYFGQQFKAEGSDEILTVKSMVMDDEFAQTIGFHLKEGRSFAIETNDSLSILLNETAVKTLGLQNPIGAHLSSGLADQNGNLVNRVFTVIGIVNDFHFQSLRDEITPLVIHSSEFFSILQYVAVLLKPGDYSTTIKQIENKWKELEPGQPFRYSFLDEQLNAEYVEEKRSGELFSVFAGLAIIIACVGLFGLSAYAASFRTKEVGIRKVLGASPTGLILLLSKDFTRLVIIAFVLSVPISWWMMNTWLQSFAYRIEIKFESFAVAGILSLTIAWLTVSYQSIKAAIVNPVKSLKSE